MSCVELILLLLPPTANRPSAADSVTHLPPTCLFHPEPCAPERQPCHSPVEAMHKGSIPTRVEIVNHRCLSSNVVNQLTSLLNVLRNRLPCGVFLNCNVVGCIVVPTFFWLYFKLVRVCVCTCRRVPVGSPSRGGDVVVY